MTLEQIKQELGYFAPGVCKLDPGAMQISEIVASDYLHFVWFIIQDVKWYHGPDGKPIAREPVVWTKHRVTVRPSALSPWRFNEAWMIANDPGLARWR